MNKAKRSLPDEHWALSLSSGHRLASREATQSHGKISGVRVRATSGTSCILNCQLPGPWFSHLLSEESGPDAL